MTSCEIIRDLLPLYHDSACSPASRALVDEHVAACEACRAMLGALEEPLPPPVNAFLLPAARLKQAKHRLVRKAVLAVTAVFCAMAIFTAGGVSLYTAAEKERVIPWEDALPDTLSGAGPWAQNEETGDIALSFRPQRYLRASCLFRRVTIDGTPRDIVILQLTQTWVRKYLDTALEGPEEVAIGTGTGLYLSRGGQKHDVAYGPEYAPAYWDPRWEYPGSLRAVYYLESPAPAALRDAPEADVLAALEQHGRLIWQDGEIV